jgi:hypothetical protein
MASLNVPARSLSTHNPSSPRSVRLLGTVVLVLLVVSGDSTRSAAQTNARDSAKAEDVRTTHGVPSDAQWRELNRAVDRGLKYLSTQQRADGSFETVEAARSAITSFCVMAFLSRGHLPGQGPYGEQIVRAVDYVMATQQPNGLLCSLPPGTEDWKLRGGYIHPICGVMLGEVYGMTDSPQQERVGEAITKALRFTKQEQQKPKRWKGDHGGWRYLSPSVAIDADMSVTAWQLMFLRSAKNAEFDVPEQQINDAVAYVRRCFDPGHEAFTYGLRGYGRNEHSRCMSGAAIVSLSLGGAHRTEEAEIAGRWLLKHPFDRFNRGGLNRKDQFFYGSFYCSQAMFQLGGEYWSEFYPVLLQTMLEYQRDDGSWEREYYQVAVLGHSYSTSLAILSLTPPYQLLPIYQR